MSDLQYPLDPYAAEIPFWCAFKCAEYSVINEKRTRDYINTLNLVAIYLPFTGEPKMTMEHKFVEGTNPVGPVLSLAGLRNTSGSDGDATFLERLSAPAAAFYETTFTTDTYRRFSNVTEASMTSEARRTFTFKYLFVPKNENESDAVDAIVTTFRNLSYPKIVPGLPERTMPQNIWTISAFGNVADEEGDASITSSWLGDPLPCVLQHMEVDKGDPSDPVLKILPNSKSLMTLLTLTFLEFETGTYAPDYNGGVLLSKSEVSFLGDAAG
jgi:hypothetical protein